MNEDLTFAFRSDEMTIEQALKAIWPWRLQNLGMAVLGDLWICQVRNRRGEIGHGNCHGDPVQAILNAKENGERHLALKQQVKATPVAGKMTINLEDLGL